MKIEITMCHSHLMSMLLQPELFQRAVVSYSATSPDVTNEGMAGYMETKVTFNTNSLGEFSKLYEDSQSYPSNRSAWYHKIREGLSTCSKESFEC